MGEESEKTKRVGDRSVWKGCKRRMRLLAEDEVTSASWTAGSGSLVCEHYLTLSSRRPTPHGDGSDVEGHGADGNGSSGLG